jgi:hypothetical protein
MPRRASKRPAKWDLISSRRVETEDEFQAAVRVVRTAVDRVEKKAVDPAVSAAAAALSRLGTSKGGMARKEALSPKRRRQIAKKAAATRWKNNR